MRRAILAVTGLAAGTTLLVVLKGSPETSQVARSVPTDRPPVVPAGASPGAPTPHPAPSGASPTAGAPAPTRTTSRTPGTAPTTRAPAPTRTTSAPRTTTVKVTGPVVANEYGNVQVQITLSGTRIVNAVALELPEKTAQSAQRSENVDSRYSGTSGQVVQRQSADLDTVSGATATSESYMRSLQAAIDKARG